MPRTAGGLPLELEPEATEGLADLWQLRLRAGAFAHLMRPRSITGATCSSRGLTRRRRADRYSRILFKAASMACHIFSECSRASAVAL
jgi:hypothetical protein